MDDAAELEKVYRQEATRIRAMLAARLGDIGLAEDHVALHRIFARLLSIGAARGPSFDPVAYVDGLENPTENFTNICGWLVQHGYSDDDIRAVLGGNIYRALQSIWIA